jgi:branched-chain amino acid transport system permease protein
MSNAASAISTSANGSIIRRNMVWLIAAAVVILLPFLFSGGVAIAVLNQMGIAIIFTVAYNMMLGQGGMLSFGHAVYFGLGGYFAIHLLNIMGEGNIVVPLIFVPLVGAFAGLAFGALFGSFSTNRAGTVFAMISLGIGEMIASSSLIFSKFSGGEEGITTDRTNAMPLAGYEFAKEIEVYYLIGAWMILAVWLMYRYSRTPIGRLANAVRDNPERAEFVGYSQKQVRFISFAASGMFAGIAGSLFAINYEIVTEETVNALTSGVVLLQAYIGGVGFFFGPIVGAIVFTLLQTLLSNYTELWALYVGVVFVSTVMYAPFGLTGLIMMHIPVAMAGRLGSLALPYIRIGIPAIICGIGFISMMEMFHFRGERGTGETDVELFGFVANVDTATPWIIVIAMAVGGFWFARRAAPMVFETWQNASNISLSGDDK